MSNFQKLIKPINTFLKALSEVVEQFKSSKNQIDTATSAEITNEIQKWII